jgi:hypothetical protein
MNQKGKIKSFAVWKTAKIAALVMAALMALPVGPLLALMTISQIAGKFQSVHPHDFRNTLAMFAVLPLIYGIFGLLVVALASWLYNVLSPRFGGIEVELMVAPDAPVSSQPISASPAN